MHELFKERIKGIQRSGELKQDIFNFLVDNNCQETAEHCMVVDQKSGEIAERFSVDMQSAKWAGYLHDISAVFPNDSRIEVAKTLGIEILPEEKAFPMIIHQKISRVMAEQIFGITDPFILDAVECHTTLKGGSTKLDRVLFVSDKISWDQKGTPPYLDPLNEQLDTSLEHGAFAYIDYLWEHKEHLRVIHPWLKEAYFELRDQLFD